MGPKHSFQPGYFDHAASSPLRVEALTALTAHAGLVGNPAALHAGGRAARAVLEDAREQLAGVIGANPDEIVFTSGGTEADTIALFGAAERWAGERPGVLIGGIEHPAVSGVSQSLGDRVRALPVEADGATSVAAIEEGLATGPVGIASLMWVNNELGTLQPLAEFVELAHATGAWAHSDAVQALGHVELDFAGSGLDLLSLSAHKVGGPVGIGALVVRRGISLLPWGSGGKQEGGLRSGTQPAVLAAGFAAAASAALAEYRAEPGRLAELRERLIAGSAAIEGCRVNGTAPGTGAVCNLGFSGASAGDIVFLLDQQGIWASTGSACRAGVDGPSEVLLGLGQSDAEARGGVRFSFGHSTTVSDVDRLIEFLPDVVAQARRVPG